MADEEYAGEKLQASALLFPAATEIMTPFWMAILNAFS